MKLILGYDEAREMGQYINAMSPWVFGDMRLETDDGTPYIGDIEIVFEEDTSHLCPKCGEYLEECICDGGI
jgi:hypothetical protein